MLNRTNKISTNMYKHFATAVTTSGQTRLFRCYITTLSVYKIKQLR